MQRRTFDILFWTLLLLGGLIGPWCYHQVWMPIAAAGADKALFERGIATPVLLWLNGYLGVFFNLRYLGNLGWLVFPLLVWALLNVVRLASWQRGLVALVVMAVAVIGGFGGFNYRYALTLLPLLTVGALLILWRAFEHFGHSRGQRSVFLGAIIAVGAWNLGLTLDHRQRVHAAERADGTGGNATRSIRDRLDPSPRDLDAWLSGSGFAAGDTLLVNNLPEYYYTTGRPGVYYWCGSDQLFLVDGPRFLFKGRSDEEVAFHLRDSLHCSGILSTRDLSAFGSRFEAFLASQCSLVGENARGYTVHRIHTPKRIAP